MPTQITLVTELSREKLLELRQEIDALLGPATDGVTSTQPAIVSASNGTVDEMARRLRSRAGPDLREFVKFLVSHYPSGTFVWEEVAAAMRQKTETVKSWHRSLSKPLNRLGREFPGTPSLLTSQWDGKRNHYTVNREWVDAINETWT